MVHALQEQERALTVTDWRAVLVLTLFPLPHAS